MNLDHGLYPAVVLAYPIFHHNDWKMELKGMQYFRERSVNVIMGDVFFQEVTGPLFGHKLIPSYFGKQIDPYYHFDLFG